MQRSYGLYKVREKDAGLLLQWIVILRYSKNVDICRNFILLTDG